MDDGVNMDAQRSQNEKVCRKTCYRRQKKWKVALNATLLGNYFQS
jgi:hypothetical protein